jgi:hypothetical protein
MKLISRSWTYCSSVTIIEKNVSNVTDYSSVSTAMINFHEGNVEEKNFDFVFARDA